MKIAVLGSRGFVGRNLAERFKREGHSVVGLTRDVIDLLNPLVVKHWLDTNRPDLIINAAAVMTSSSNVADAHNNLGVFMNFYHNSHMFGKFIDTGSGAEFDRSRNIDMVEETELFRCWPADSYGFGQNLKGRLCVERENFYHLRIFNCFGTGEQPSRLIARFLNSDAQFRIINDRYFDFFGIDDLYTVVKHVSNAKYIPIWQRDINCVYMQKIKLSDMIRLVCDVRGLSYDSFTIDSTSPLNYTGNGGRLASLIPDLIGLQRSVEKY
jgi:GDP-L-fucose synthase